MSEPESAGESDRAEPGDHFTTRPIWAAPTAKPASSVSAASPPDRRIEPSSQPSQPAESAGPGVRNPEKSTVEAIVGAAEPEPTVRPDRAEPSEFLTNEPICTHAKPEPAVVPDRARRIFYERTHLHPREARARGRPGPSRARRIFYERTHLHPRAARARGRPGPSPARRASWARHSDAVRPKTTPSRREYTGQGYQQARDPIPPARGLRRWLPSPESAAAIDQLGWVHCGARHSRRRGHRQRAPLPARSRPTPRARSQTSGSAIVRRGPAISLLLKRSQSSSVRTWTAMRSA